MNCVNKIFRYEMVHWDDGAIFLAHRANKIVYRKNGIEKIVTIPTKCLGIKKVLMFSRKLRRLFRLDKTIIIPTNHGFIAIRNSHIFRYDDLNGWTETDVVLNCRNPMYNGVLTIRNRIYIGEYGNPNGVGKRILMSEDEGKTWRCVYQFKHNDIRHIHALLWDKFENKIWIFTGDFNPEPQVFKANLDFDDIERVGGGTQKWRACHAIFSENYVDWIMDSPLEEVHHIRYDRQNRKIIVGETFDGPVWYARKYEDAFYATSVQEIGPSHKDKKMHLYKSNDFIKWTHVCAFKHDGWPKGYFRYGVITPVRSKDPMFSCEGVKGLDGMTFIIKKDCF